MKGKLEKDSGGLAVLDWLAAEGFFRPGLKGPCLNLVEYRDKCRPFKKINMALGSQYV